MQSHRMFLVQKWIDRHLLNSCPGVLLPSCSICTLTKPVDSSRPPVSAEHPTTAMIDDAIA